MCNANNTTRQITIDIFYQSEIVAMLSNGTLRLLIGCYHGVPHWELWRIGLQNGYEGECRNGHVAVIICQGCL